MASISKWYKWGYYSQGNGTSLIRRYRKVNGKIEWETYPKEKYQDFSPTEIQSLLKRLNVTLEIQAQEAQKRYEFDHAYINKTVLENFQAYLETRANDKGHITTLMACLRDYTLEFYINQEKLPDPNFWKKKEANFGKFLLKQKLSSGYIARIIQNTNRFLQFLSETYPDEIRFIKLRPVAEKVLKEQELLNEDTREKFITEDAFIFICKNIDPVLVPLVKLGYKFGLRRAEVLGLVTDNVFEDTLRVEKQLKKVEPIPYRSFLKSREKRDVPYWYSTPEEAYALINQMKLIHPSTLSHRFGEEMERLGFDFEFHDLRRTFITRALRDHHYMDVRLAAGHTDLETTNKYIQDDRQLKKKRFVPGLKSVK